MRSLLPRLPETARVTRADYVSGHLSEQEVRRLFNAAVLAFCISKHLSRFISIHLDAGGVVDRREFIWRFNKLASEWLKARTGHPACYLWVLEKPVDGMKTYSRGFNVHILVHVPYHLQNDFYRKESDWLKAAGAKSARGVRKSRKIDFSGPDYPGAHYLREGLLGLMRYLAKGIEPASASIFGIKPEPQGKVSGKR